MQPPAYLYAVLLGDGRWAVCCEHCGTTLAYTTQPNAADRIMHAHELAHPSLVCGICGGGGCPRCDDGQVIGKEVAK